MAPENVDRLRAWAAGWEADPGKGPLRDRDTGEPVTSYLAADVVYEDGTIPDHAAETYRGVEGVIRATERWTDPFETLTVDLERIVGTGDCLVSIHRLHARAKHTRIEFDEPLAILWRFRAGKVIYFRSFRFADEALEAAGLSD